MAVDEAVRVAERSLPGRHPRVVGDHLLDQPDHLGAPALKHAARDEGASVDHRGVGLAGFLSDLQCVLGEALAGLEVPANTRHRGRDEARVPSLCRLPRLLGDRLQTLERREGPRELTQLDRCRHLRNLTMNSRCRSRVSATSALSSRTCSARRASVSGAQLA